MQLAQVDLAHAGGGVGEELAGAPFSLADDGGGPDRGGDGEGDDDGDRREQEDGQGVRRLALRAGLVAAVEAWIDSCARSGSTSRVWLICSTTSTLPMVVRLNSRIVRDDEKKMAPRPTIGTQKSLAWISCLRSVRAHGADLAPVGAAGLALDGSLGVPPAPSGAATAVHRGHCSTSPIRFSPLLRRTAK